MHIETYDPKIGSVIDSNAPGLDFGDVIQSQHCYQPIVLRFRPDTETTVSDMTCFLENKGGWTDAQFGFYSDSTFKTIESGSSYLSNHMTEIKDASSSSPGGQSVDSTSSYVWMDVDIPLTQTGIADVNYRLFFNYT
jgi:hypothetical protein